MNISGASNNSENRDFASALEKWLDESDKNFPEDWKAIGKEVYFRKTLLMSAATSLKDFKWDLKNPWKLAATDVFVEKAQKRLSSRAEKFMLFGALAAVVALVSTILVLRFALHAKLEDLFGSLNVDGYSSLLVGLKVTAMAGLAGGTIFFFASLSKALLHEGTALYKTRHALRLGRLYVYLKDGKVSLKELEAVFAWNREFTTAFSKMKISNLSSPLEKFADVLKTATKSIGKKKNKKSKNKIET